MDVLESYIDTSKLFILIFKTKLTPFKLIYMNKIVSGRFRELKNKEKGSVG